MIADKCSDRAQTWKTQRNKLYNNIQLISLIFFLQYFLISCMLLYPFCPLQSTLKALKGKLKPLITFNPFVLPLYAYLPSAGVKTVRLVFGPTPALVSAPTYTSYVVKGTRLLNTNLWSFVLLSRTWPGIENKEILGLKQKQSMATFQ